MAGSDDSGDKTEKPTPKKLQDARKKGDVSKSKDIAIGGDSDPDAAIATAHHPEQIH